MQVSIVEIALIAVLWLFLGIFICTKYSWYTKNQNDSDAGFMSFMTIAFSPLVFVVILFIRMFIEDWDKN